MKDLDFMTRAWEMAEKCQSPYKFGAVVAKEGELIASDYNHVAEIPDVSAHAEVSALRKANLDLKTYNLEGCTLYATHEPCVMCFACAMWAGVKRVVYEVPKKDQDDLMYESSLDILEFNKLALRTNITIDRFSRP